MIPVLYNKDEQQFRTYGLGEITDIINPKVTRERNGQYLLYFQYPQDAKFSEVFEEDMRIKSDAGVRTKWQTFEITRVIRKEGQLIEVFAKHISQSLLKDALNPNINVPNSNAQQALNIWNANRIGDEEFDVWSDITTTNSTSWNIREVSNAFEALAGVQGSILNVWGGEYEFDNKTIRLHKEMGRKLPVPLEYGRNITNLEQDQQEDSIYTSIYPFAVFTPEGVAEPVTVTLPEYFVDGKYLDMYPKRKIQVVDFSGEFNHDDTPTVERLRVLANQYLETNEVGLPHENLKVSYIDLSRTLDYKEFQTMEEVELNDRLPIFYPGFGITNENAKAVVIDYDPVKEENISIELGVIGQSFRTITTGGIGSRLDKVEKQQNETVSYVVNNKGNRIWYTTPDENMEHKIGDTWFEKNGPYTRIRIWNGSQWIIELDSEDIHKNAQEVETALSEAEAAKQAAEQAYTNAVTQAERLVAEQSVAFDSQMSDVNQEINTVKTNIDTAIANVNQEIANNFTSLSDSISDVDNIATQAKTDAQTALSNATQAKTDAQTALSNASTALGQAQSAVSTAASANNKAIKSSVVDWALSSSGTTPPTSGWQTSVPTPSSTQYTWSRTTITLNDGTTIPSYTVSKIGVKGDKGDPGAPGAGGAKGDKGDAGVNAPKIIAVKQYFYLSSSNTSQTGGSWTETIPVWSGGKYYWTRVVTSYDNATTTESVPVLDNSLNQSLVTSLEAKSATQTLSTTVSQHATQIAAKASQTTVDTLTGRVSTAEGSIEVQAGQIALKANQTTVDTLTGRVGTAETNISANTTAINLRATKSSVDTLTGRVTTAEGTITAQAGQIALRATTATVNALTGRVSAAEASIVTQAGKIDLAATKTELTTAINGIQVGGRNLIRNSQGSFKVNYSGIGENNKQYIVGPDLTTPITIDNEYTISLRARGTIQIMLFRISSTGNSPISFVGKNSLSETEFRDFSMTFRPHRDELTAIYLTTGYNTGVSGWYEVDENSLKLEKGNKATDWTPAPEDVDASIAAVQSNLTVEAGKITALTSRVSGSETNISNVTQTVSGITSTISTLRTDVNGKATIVALNQVKSTADGNKTTISNHAGRLTTVETNVNGLQSTVASKADKSQITQLSNSISSVVTDLSNVDVIEQPGAIGKTFRNVHTVWNNTPGVRGMVRINTPITNSAMTTIRFTGYNYQGNRSTIDLTVSFYGYTASYILEHSYTNRGDFAITDVRVGRDSSGRAVILLGVPTTYWSYPSIDVEYVKISFMSPPDSWKDGWSSSFTTVTTGITALTTLQGMDTQSRITQNATNINLRVTKGEVVSQLNIDAGRVLIQTNKLLLDANTYIMGTTFANDVKAKSIEAVNANITSIRTSILTANVITSGMVATSTALITKIFATDATVTTLTGKTAFINSIKAISISADKVTTGTLNAANVNIINLNASAITTGTLSGVNASWNLNTGIFESKLASAPDTRVLMNGGKVQSFSNRYGTGELIGGRLALEDNLGSAVVNTGGLVANASIGTANYTSSGIQFNPTGGSVSKLDFDTSNWRLRLSSYNGAEMGTIVGTTYSRRLSVGGGAGGILPFVDMWAELNMNKNKISNVQESVYSHPSNGDLGRIKFQDSGTLYVSGRQTVALTVLGGNNSTIYTKFTVGHSENVSYQNINMNGNSVTNQSDRRLKTNITATSEKGLANIRQWSFVDYDYDAADYPKGRQFGLIAQDSPGIGFQGDNGLWQINASKQTMMNSLGIQELDNEVTRIGTFVSQHELKIQQLEQKIAELESKIA